MARPAYVPRPNADPGDVPDELVEGIRGRQTMPIDAERIAGLLRPFGGRARVVLSVILQGFPTRPAAGAAGITDGTVREWMRRDPEFRQAVETAREWAFGANHEAEIYDRAMDRSDRASGRLLELVAKRHEPEFRDKQQLQISVLRQAVEAQQAWITDALPMPELPSPTVIDATPEPT